MKHKDTLDDVVSLVNNSTNGYYLAGDVRDLLASKKLNMTFVAKNLSYLVDNVSSNKFVRLMNFISMEEEVSNSMLQNISAFLDRFKKRDISDKDVEIFFEAFKCLPNSDKYLKSNLGKIIDSVSVGVLFELSPELKKLKKLSIRFAKKIDDKINQNQDEVCKHILIKSLRKGTQNTNISLKDINDYSLTLQILLRELLNSEHKRFSDMRKVGEGVYSNVYQIGTKIIKIGAPRQTHKIPNHRRILQPIVRKELTNEMGEPIGSIEITDEVDTSKETLSKITEEDLYKIYKELRVDGIVWGDPKIDNLGVLKRENKPTLKGKDFYVAPNSVGFRSEIFPKPLQRGDFVITDLDYLYYENDKDKKVNKNSYVLEFERRYRSEAEQEIKMKENMRQKEVDTIKLKDEENRQDDR